MVEAESPWKSQHCFFSCEREKGFRTMVTIMIIRMMMCRDGKTRNWTRAFISEHWGGALWCGCVALSKRMWHSWLHPLRPLNHVFPRARHLDVRSELKFELLVLILCQQNQRLLCCWIWSQDSWKPQWLFPGTLKLLPQLLWQACRSCQLLKAKKYRLVSPRAAATWRHDATDTARLALTLAPNRSQLERETALSFFFFPEANKSDKASIALIWQRTLLEPCNLTHFEGIIQSFNLLCVPQNSWWDLGNNGTYCFLFWLRNSQGFVPSHNSNVPSVRELQNLHR